jgi:hypothetical protein
MSKHHSRRILANHKQVGKRFIPPFVATLGPLSEVRWVDDVLPELLWLALLNHQHGWKDGADLCLVLPMWQHVHSFNLTPCSRCTGEVTAYP